MAFSEKLRTVLLGFLGSPEFRDEFESEVLETTTAEIAALAVTTAKIAASAVTDAKVATGIDAAKLGDGTVSNAEFQYLDGVTSAVQTQINAKSPSASPTFTGTLTTPATASRALVTGAASELSASATTATELGYVGGVTSAIQTQINAKAPSASPTFTGTLTTPAIASRALVSGAASELDASATTAVELGYVSGVTSAIQTQMNLKAPLASPTFSGTITTPLTASRAVVSGASSEFAVSAVTGTELGYVSGVTSAIQTQLNALVIRGARAKNSATAVSGTLATIVWTTEDYDTEAALASGVYTVPAGQAGYYKIDAGVALSGTFALNNTTVLEIQVNSVAKTNRTQYIAGAVTNDAILISDTLLLAAADTLRIQISSSGTTPAIVSSDTRNYFSIAKI